ncbi:hypothetical protein ENTCAN_08079 [Enterobacter cancerogenus ATCC 35316]|nr:hypothetical protein ENTCAN_08079 [Enterobacter cancerogenus ATCC 35316]
MSAIIIKLKRCFFFNRHTIEYLKQCFVLNRSLFMIQKNS